MLYLEIVLVPIAVILWVMQENKDGEESDEEEDEGLRVDPKDLENQAWEEAIESLNQETAVAFVQSRQYVPCPFFSNLLFEYSALIG